MSDSLLENNRVVNIVKTLASADPDYLPFVDQHRELSAVHTPHALEIELGDNLLKLLQLMPEQWAQLARLKSNRQETFDAGVASVPILVAVAFLLRTHLRIKRTSSGKWEFLAENKPGDSQFVTQLLARIAAILSR